MRRAVYSNGWPGELIWLTGWNTGDLRCWLSMSKKAAKAEALMAKSASGLRAMPMPARRKISDSCRNDCGRVRPCAASGAKVWE